ncbi:SDR family oxidoreductase [Thaumasiovibrio subtropicus]|uniref:SDR family oxidoreductase n=1 Tax=Thaumasiovibrio subtropicus TaxID=1891207 RepID=UPI000B35E464|nr:SDR family oxidoreductase [Thaumasiovibrio subtropicus]
MTQKVVLITGANRGIGLAMTQAFLSKKWQVVAISRQTSDNDTLDGLANSDSNLTTIRADITNYPAIHEIEKRFPFANIDLLINNAGYYGPKGYELGNTDIDEWRRVLEINTIAPLKLVETFLSRLRPTKATIAMLSSKVGSMTENTSGGGYIYRSSKAALNSVTKSLHNDLYVDGVKCVALHPGWVQTAMGGPNALISPEVSANGLISVIENLTDAQSGHFINYDGTNIPW